MVRSGHGLPCWDPTPQGGQPVIPGDIGTYTPIRGFKKIFNVWDDVETAKFAPDRTVHVQADYLRQGDTILYGATGRTVYAPDG